LARTGGELLSDQAGSKRGGSIHRSEGTWTILNDSLNKNQIAALNNISVRVIASALWLISALVTGSMLSRCRQDKGAI